MRKALFALGLGLSVVVSGAAIAGGDLGPSVVLVMGIVLVGAVAALGMSTERLAWLAACLLVVTIQWNGIRVAGGAFGNVFLVLAFGGMVTHAVLARRPVSAPPALMLAGLAFLLAALLAMIFPAGSGLNDQANIQLSSRLTAPVYLTHRSDVLALITFELSFIVVPLVLIAAGSTARRCRRLMDLWTAGAVVNAFVGVTDTLGIVHLSPYALSSGTRSSALTVHPNYLALGASMAIPTAMVWIGRSPRWTLAGLAALATLLGGVYASGSRAGAVAAVVAVGVTAVAIPRLRRRTLLVLPALGMLGIVVLLFTSTGDHILHQVRLGGSGAVDLTIQGSNFQRHQAAHVGLAQFRAHPVAGVGFSVIADAHNIYLELLASGGIIALVAFLTFLGGLADAIRRGLAGAQRAEVAAGTISVAVWLTNGAADNQLADKYLYIVPGLLFAMARVARRATTTGAGVDASADLGECPAPTVAADDGPARVPVPA
ncbi:O-antigen ligase family protein [Paraconexibacter antarcticus]|uniref:O-antigen ligase family protein n=1 Tax=Paraconexibacter antarcticus TaxID=2949664 RepID=A0ABY5DLB9_9ACTN|nr:O-antigen ligase family protein [Paraconexibacter antarcticus]UTI62616.1 O-antigen ligase family protein [Paraconexibacter antarcticus]